MYALTDYHYDLPERLIAQHPAPERDLSRLFVLDRFTCRHSHLLFMDVVGFLEPGDVLVVNNTRVIPGRLYGRKPTGGRIEALVLNHHPLDTNSPAGIRMDEATALVKASKPCRVGMRLEFGNMAAEVIHVDGGMVTFRTETTTGLADVLEQSGRMPLPPYIHRRPDDNEESADRESYQTVYASSEGAVAAPTAGLHFTPALLERIRNLWVDIVEITLHVGYGTFLPVRVDDIREHRMHDETFIIGDEAAERINQAKADGRRVIAVGTTSVRSLEYAARNTGHIVAGAGACDLYIYPGFEFRVVDAMITNFHLPESTLIMLVSAFAGREKVLNAYAEAVRREYRFYSYGDAMLIL